MKLPKILMALGALTILLVFTAPIWSIELIAPQYPDGVKMYIWVNKITGEDPSTLQNINILNHYIGMKYIEPESIPELTYFPYILYALVVIGVIIAFVGNRKLYLLFAVLLVILGAAGIYDFYLWEYDYGHNLDPHAPIKIEGMAYQPPLLGEKWLLNFLAKSYPAIGIIYFIIPIVTSLLAFFLQKPKR